MSAKSLASVATFALGMLIAHPVFAWTATAKGATSTIHYSEVEAATKELAVSGALQGCEKLAKSGCVLIGKAWNGPAALAVTVGGNMVYTHYDANPELAQKLGMEACGNSSCYTAAMYWDPGNSWISIAQSRGYTHVAPDQRSKAEAEAAAMAGCKKSSPPADPCKIWQTEGEPAWFAMATAKRDRFAAEGIALSFTSQEDADKTALQNCIKNDNNQTTACAVTARIVNAGTSEAPRTIKKILNAIHIDNLRREGK